MTRGHVIAIHDVTPRWMDEAIALRNLVQQTAEGPVSLLIVPRFRGVAHWPADHAGWIREAVADGDEPVIHGLTHVADTGGADERELRGCSIDEATRRLLSGAAALGSMGIVAAGAIAPCYAYPSGIATAASRAGIAWWANRRRIISHEVSALAPAIGLGASTTTRRALSPIAARGALHALADAPRIRIDLHPADMHHRRLRDTIARLLDRAQHWHGPRMTHATMLAAAHDGTAVRTAA